MRSRHLEITESTPVTTGNATVSWGGQGCIPALPIVGPGTVVTCREDPITLDRN